MKVAIVTFLGTILAALLSAGAVIATDNVDVNLSPGSDTNGEAALARVQGQLDDAEAENGDLADQLSAAEARIEELEESGTGTPPGSPPLSGPDDDDEGSGVFRSTDANPVEFAGGFGIDIDSTSSDWGVTDRYSNDVDLHFIVSSYPGTRLIAGNQVEFSVVDHEPTKAECDANTVIVGDLTPEQTRQGSRLCVHTSEGRFAFVEVAALDQAAGTISLHVEVWT